MSLFPASARITVVNTLLRRGERREQRWKRAKARSNIGAVPMPSPVWVNKGRRTPVAHKLVLSVHARLRAHGWTRANRKKAVSSVIGELRDTNPAYKKWSVKTLIWAYYRVEPLPPPPRTEEERGWGSLLIQWGEATKRHPARMSAKQAWEIVDRLIAVAPQHRRADLGQLFIHVGRSIHRNGRDKIKWLRRVINRLAANAHYWPIPNWQHGRRDVIAGRIETYLANAPEKRAHKRDIAAALSILPTTAQTTLCSLERARRIDRVASGVYALPVRGVSCARYIPADKAILDSLSKGDQLSCAELRAKTGKSEGAVHAALHRLHKAKSIVRTNRGRYALAGSASPHVYARDAMTDALRSGKKTMPELITATGKNYYEIMAAVRREEAKGRVRVIQAGPRRKLVAVALVANHSRRHANHRAGAA
jgi:hypothetical protein